MRVDYKFSNKLNFGADFSYSQTGKDANWTDNVRAQALSKMPNNLLIQSMTEQEL